MSGPVRETGTSTPRSRTVRPGRSGRDRFWDVLAPPLAVLGSVAGAVLLLGALAVLAAGIAAGGI